MGNDSTALFLFKATVGTRVDYIISAASCDRGVFIVDLLPIIRLIFIDGENFVYAFLPQEPSCSSVDYYGIMDVAEVT